VRNFYSQYSSLLDGYTIKRKAWRMTVVAQKVISLFYTYVDSLTVVAYDALTTKESYLEILSPFEVKLKHTNHLGVAEIFVMMQKCCLGYTFEEHEQREKIIRALGDRAVLSRFKVLNDWTTMTTAYTIFQRSKQKILSKVFSGLQLGVGRQQSWIHLCGTFQSVLRRRMCSLVFRAL
jgi:hypothetical protein